MSETKSGIVGIDWKSFPGKGVLPQIESTLLSMVPNGCTGHERGAKLQLKDTEIRVGRDNSINTTCVVCSIPDRNSIVCCAACGFCEPHIRNKFRNRVPIRWNVVVEAAANS